MKRIYWALLFLCLAGCQQEMARQPSYRPLQPSSLFPDGMSARPLEPGTIDRDMRLVTGKKPVSIKGWERAAAVVAQVPGNPLIAASATADWSRYVDSFPM